MDTEKQLMAIDVKQQKADEKIAKREGRRLNAVQKIADLEENRLKEAQFVEISLTKPAEVAAYAKLSAAKVQKSKIKANARGAALSRTAKIARKAARKLSYVTAPRVVAEDTKS
jgi:LysM repeat protein